jgi:hypothetical protein
MRKENCGGGKGNGMRNFVEGLGEEADFSTALLLTKA